MARRRAGRPRTLREYHWAHSTWRYGTMPPPDLSDITGFARAWATDYLDQYHPGGLCPDCGTFDNDAAAALIVREATAAHLSDATSDVTSQPRQVRAALAMRLVAACETAIIAHESNAEPWQEVIAAHATECPVHAADPADDAWAWRHAGR